MNIFLSAILLSLGAAHMGRNNPHDVIPGFLCILIGLSLLFA